MSYLRISCQKSRMTGDCHVRFCERLGVKLPLSTRPSVGPSDGSKSREILLRTVAPQSVPLPHISAISQQIRILGFNTITKETYDAAIELPNTGQVTTTAIQWGEDIIVPSGEMRPGGTDPENSKGRDKRG